MHISKERKPCDIKFSELDCGDVFYYRGRHDEKERLYMKIEHIEYDISRMVTVKYNAVNLENGLLEFVENDTTVMIANVHIEND